MFHCPTFTMEVARTFDNPLHYVLIMSCWVWLVIPIVLTLHALCIAV
jgi:hypothetical protein